MSTDSGKPGFCASENAIIARIEPVMRSRNTEETVRELNEKIKAAGITAEYKAAEINTNGKLSRELAGAVTKADFARERRRIIFGDAALRNSPAPKGDGRPLNTQATSKAEEPENFPTFHQSARQLAQRKFLTESTEEITDSNVSKYTKDGQIFLTDYNSGTESHVSVQDRHGTGTRHNAEITASDILAGDDTDIIGIRTSYKETTPSPADRTEAAHHSYSESESPDKEIYTAVPVNESDFHSGTESHTEDTRFNAADRAARKSFTENELAYSNSANSAGNAPSNESRAAYTVQTTGDGWNAAAETEPSYISVHGRKDGRFGKKAGQNPSQPRGDISVRTKQMLTPEQEEAARLERMNANYEHDRAILAKADPLFARNHFRDVGHAEGCGEASDREIKKSTQKLQENMLEEINGKQL